MKHVINKDDGVIVITGGASGIGLALTHYLLKSGWKVLALDVREKCIEYLRTELQNSHPEMLRLETANVTD